MSQSAGRGHVCARVVAGAGPGRLDRVMLAGIPVPTTATAELAGIVRMAGADELADRLERAISDEVKLLALTIGERAVILNTLDDPPNELAELRAVLMNEPATHRSRLLGSASA